MTNNFLDEPQNVNELGGHEIATEFSNLKALNYVTVIPIGFPNAGKTLWLASILSYAKNTVSPLFSITRQRQFPFNGGFIKADYLDNNFKKGGDLPGRTPMGTLDVFGLNILPSKDKLPNLNLAFLDLAGEDVEKIKTSVRGDFSSKIKAIFNGLGIDKSPIVFVLITPFAPPSKKGKSISDAHKDEDALHSDFLNYLQVDEPELLKHSTFFIVVSQWDKNNDQKLTVENFIKNNRPSLYSIVKNVSVIWGNYSIGKILETYNESDGTINANLATIDKVSPERFWKKIYQVCTGRELDEKTWWEKLFS
jgi:hypothetical protein